MAETLDCVLHLVLMEGDVSGALDYAQERIKALLQGKAWLGELVMTGGLWRVTGN